MHELTREYLRAVTGARHDTANRLGAAPSGFWAAAEQTTVRHGHDSATVSVHSPGIGRVAHDVTITPGADAKGQAERRGGGLGKCAQEPVDGAASAFYIRRSR